MTARARAPLVADDWLRILATHYEMPGLRLTVDQLCRPSGLDREPCTTALRSLVDDGLLDAHGQHYILRHDC